MNQPDRVLSLVLFYTAPAVHPDFLTTDETPNASPIFDTDPWSMTLEKVVEQLMIRARQSVTPGQAFDETKVRELIVRSPARNPRLDGLKRQAAAMFRSGDWREKLGALTMPTAVIHGRDDRLVRSEAAFELARRITDAELHLYPHMGHEIIQDRWADFVRIIDKTARRSPK